MFEELLLRGPRGRQIRLDTREGLAIPNEQASTPDERQLNVYAELRRRHGRFWKHRKDACGVYNCFGLAFASRRTSIYEDAAIRSILRDDQYREILQRNVVAGDLVAYCDRDGTVIYHVGVVTRCEKLVDIADAFVPWVLSKWNDGTGEDEHHFAEHCLPGEVTIKYYTDRPA